MEGEPLGWVRLRSTRHASIGVATLCVDFKYCMDILISEVAEYTREVLKEILLELGCEAIAVEVMLDHVHVFALCPPRHSPAYIVNYLKGKSARRILQRFPELKSRASRGKLWSRSYFVATVGAMCQQISLKGMSRSSGGGRNEEDQRSRAIDRREV